MAGSSPLTLIPLREINSSHARPAGDFANWLAAVDRAVNQQQPLDVPCGTCNACCRSGYFIRVHKTEHKALEAIPKELLFPAPGEDDILVMGYDQEGRCPMLKLDQCSIYESRPATCRTYDCRLFSGCNIDAGPTRGDVNQVVEQWQFSYQSETATRHHQGLVTAASFLLANKDELQIFSDEPLHIAILALRCLPLFLDEPLPDADGQLQRVKKFLQSDHASAAGNNRSM